MLSIRHGRLSRSGSMRSGCCQNSSSSSSRHIPSHIVGTHSSVNILRRCSGNFCPIHAALSIPQEPFMPAVHQPPHVSITRQAVHVVLETRATSTGEDGQLSVDREMADRVVHGAVDSQSAFPHQEGAGQERGQEGPHSEGEVERLHVGRAGLAPDLDAEHVATCTIQGTDSVIFPGCRNQQGNLT